MRSLVLIGTSTGGKNQVLGPGFREYQRALAASIQQPDSIEAHRATAKFAFAPETIETRLDVMEEYICSLRSPLIAPLDIHVLITQGIRTWGGTYDRLAQIRVPTLVMTGKRDLMVDPRNSQILHERIDGSTLVTIPNTGHLFLSEAPEAANEAILSFLRRVAKD